MLKLGSLKVKIACELRHKGFHPMHLFQHGSQLRMEGQACQPGQIGLKRLLQIPSNEVLGVGEASL